MALAVFSHDGDAVDYTPSAEVASGDVVVQNELVGVARTPIAANTPGSIAVTGVFDFPKATGAGTAIVGGAKVFWDETNKQVSIDSGLGTNKYLGKTIVATTDDDTTVRVRLSQ